MANLIGRRITVWPVLTALLFTASVVSAHSPAIDEEEPEIEPRFLPAAEEALRAGEAEVAERIYRQAFSEAPDAELRLALAGPWARTAFVAQKLDELLDETLAVPAAPEWGAWELPALQATVFYYLQDLHGARAILQEAAGDEDVHRFRSQVIAWSRHLEDYAPAIDAMRQALSEVRTDERHATYLHALLEAGEREALAEHLAEQRTNFLEEVDFWRTQLAEFAEYELLELAEGPLEAAWSEAQDRPEVRFALGELRVFQGRMEEAATIFWEVFEMEEEPGTEDGIAYFQRLNLAFHDRYGVKYRIGLATGRYGSPMCQAFSFLGLKKNVRVTNTWQARIAALLFLRELQWPEQASPEFLERVRAGLDRVERPPVQRIYAFASIGAARATAEEVRRLVESPGTDNIAADFSLIALNRFVLGTDKFPDLRDQILELADGVVEKFDDTRPLAVRRRNLQMHAQVFRRLGAERRDGEGVVPGSREEYLARIGATLEEGQPEQAESIFRELAEAMPDEPALPGILLYIAGALREADRPGRAAALAVEFLEHHYPIRAGGGGVQAPLTWRPAAGFPPSNPYFDEERLEALHEVFALVQDDLLWQSFTERLAERRGELSPEKRAAACVAETSLFWWREDRQKALAVAGECAAELNQPDLHLLHAHLLGREERYEEARAVLDALEGAEQTADGVVRLRFAFAVAEGDVEAARDFAKKLPAGLSAAERLEVGEALVGFGLADEGRLWVEGVRLEELHPQEGDRLRQVQLESIAAGGSDSRAAAMARMVLLAEPPVSFRDLSTHARQAALGILEAAGQLAAYREELHDLLAAMPHSMTLRFLLGEASEYLWLKAKDEQARDQAVERYREVVELRPEDAGLLLELAEWATSRGLNKVAVENFDRLMEIDAQAALLDTSLLFAPYRREGALPRLVDSLEQWEVPEAWSVDDFYGLQPTDHIFRPLGIALLEDGEEEAAERAWLKGLALNPLNFTEEMRMRLVEFYFERERVADAIAVMRPYVSAPDPDSEFYAMHPFVDTVPRWLAARLGASDMRRSPVERFLRLIQEAEAGEQLLEAARGWREDHPERFGAALFHVFSMARLNHPGWEEERAALREAFPSEPGIWISLWQGAERLFASLGRSPQPPIRSGR
jgi:tetratricopeptide (TPR) repeat protein